jgi:hypothetical protein
MLERRLVDRAAKVLAAQGMPADEVRAVLTTADPGLIHQHLELHRERLEERLVARLRTLATVERLLAEAAARRRA